MSSDWVFPTVPPELKSLAPYFQRAQELKVKDAAMAYWCTYYGIQQGITTKAHNREARPFLFQAMSILEQMKVNLGDNEAVSDDEVGAAYIENFALRVFNMADNEDRREQATRSTAKKFLASANFFELLHIFDKPVGTDVCVSIEEKIRYAKWKAADLAKAFREGRKPIPGDANAPTATPHPAPAVLETVPLEAPQEFAPSISAWSPGTSLAPSPAVRGTQSLEPSPVVGADVPLPPTISDSGSPPLEQPVDLTSPEQTLHTPASSAVTDTPRTPSPRAFDGHLNLHYEHEGFVTPGMWSTMATPGTDDVVPPFVPVPVVPVKKVHFSPSVIGGLSSTSSSVTGSPPASPEGYAPSLPTGVPPVIHKVPSPTGPLSPSGFLSPRKMPEVLPPLFPRAPPQIPSAPSGARLPGVPSHLSPQPPPPPAHSSLPKSPSPPPDLTSTQISRIQKHCRFAISALDYEDAETARKELRAALAMLGD
ncbi:DUF605-domain-containing protein [Ramaria rubella]|nr:DUF605-domain-containing protein [Ramaria rubella]